MVQPLVSAQPYPVSQDLMSWQDVHRHHAMTLFKNLEDKAQNFKNPESLQGLLTDLEQTYDVSRKHIILLEARDALGIMKQYFSGMIPLNINFLVTTNDLVWKDCLIVLLNFLVRLTKNIQKIASEEKPSAEILATSITVLLKLVMEGKVMPSQGWEVVLGLCNHGLTVDPTAQFFYFCGSMVLSGCRLGATEAVFS
ncbi:hypothetical protein Drorol1_Dr00021528 [Drosera rotundifolia]